ncbi:MAG: GTPase domain-containing protein [Alphaproteobacteria bacterium]|nr:GTPase domain-containing protein [Alphaproteobacteria bacterium]
MGSSWSDPPGLWRGSWWRGFATRASQYFSLSPDKVAAGAASAAAAEQARQSAQLEAPVIWLLGKVQSGKSSIIQRLTGATQAEIGEGYRAKTRTAMIFDFPAEAPLLRFLDTRGLGETGYDPAEDLAASEAKANLLIAVMRAGDPSQQPVIDVLRRVRDKHPDWPVIVAQTWLHARYPAKFTHPLPYPFTGRPEDAGLPGVPDDLSRALTHQRGSFSDMPGTAPILFVPIDFTRPEDGLSPADYGVEALLSAIETAAPATVRSRLSALRASEGDDLSTAAHGLIVGFSFAAAGADVVPVVGMVAVPGIQGALLHALAGRFGVEWSREHILAFLSSLGTLALTRYGLGFGLRQLAKLIPVYGQSVGAAAAAAASFIFTYALGRAACVYLAARRIGQKPKDDEIVAAYAKGLREAFDIFNRRKVDGTGSTV